MSVSNYRVSAVLRFIDLFLDNHWADLCIQELGNLTVAIRDLKLHTREGSHQWHLHMSTRMLMSDKAVGNMIWLGDI